MPNPNEPALYGGYGREWLNILKKSTALKVSPSVVCVISRNLPAGMLVTNGSKRFRRMFDDNKERVFGGSGVIIECEVAGDGTYAGVVLTYATLFVRTNDVQPENVEVDVHLSDGKLCKGKVLACDFHYNLAAVRIVSDAPLQPAKLRELDDVISIDPNQQFSLRSNKLFQLRSHSNLFKILPGDKVLAIGRFFEDPHSPCIACGDFSVKRSPLDCKELYSVIGISNEVYYGGPVINYSGEVIGIMLHKSSFLPMNIVSRWWNNYKTSRKFGRPWIAVEVTNLHTAHAAFLEKFIRNFPNISTGVLVEEVEQDSPAYCSGLRRLDVITHCDGVIVRSTLEFFEKIWEKVGQSVELNVLRAGRGGQLHLTITVGEAIPDQFYRWQLPLWFTRNEVTTELL